MNTSNLIIRPITKQAKFQIIHRGLLRSKFKNRFKEFFFKDMHLIEIEYNQGEYEELVDLIENITGDWDKMNWFFELDPKETRCVADYSYFKDDIDNLREVFIAMNYDLKEHQGLMSEKIKNMIETMEWISSEMLTKRDFFIHWLLSMGFSEDESNMFRDKRHDLWNDKCSIEIGEFSYRVRDDRKGVSLKDMYISPLNYGYNRIGYLYKDGFDVNFLEEHLERYRLI